MRKQNLQISSNPCDTQQESFSSFSSSTSQHPPLESYSKIFKTSGTAVEKVGHVGWWVAELDIADAISRLMLSNHSSPKEVNFAGRRSWKSNQVFEELQILYKRTIAGQSGSFTTEHLTKS